MLATDRLDAEITFHDRQADERASRFRTLEHLVFSDEDYLDHESWIRPAFASLGSVAGLEVLDLGCGHAMASVVLARQGARVTATDLSTGYLREATRRAKANGVELRIVQADGERLPFADTSFDRIWGNAILHHLEPMTAASELFRVLRPGGRAVFCEPWGDNPFLEAARRWLPYPGKARTRDERPLRANQIAHLRGTFPSLEVQGHQLLAMVRRVLPWPWLTGPLGRCDNRILQTVPSLWRWCRYVVLSVRKPCPNESAV